MCVCVCVLHSSDFVPSSSQLSIMTTIRTESSEVGLLLLSLCVTLLTALHVCTVLYIAVQMALCRTYHRYSVDGIAATTERYYSIQHDLNVIDLLLLLLLLLLLCRPPVIYVGDSGLPMDCLHVCTRVCGDYTLTCASV